MPQVSWKQTESERRLGLYGVVPVNQSGLKTTNSIMCQIAPRMRSSTGLMLFCWELENREWNFKASGEEKILA